MAEPQVGFQAEISGIALTVSDGEYPPVVKVAPRYPVRAMQRIIDGIAIEVAGVQNRISFKLDVWEV